MLSLYINDLISVNCHEVEFDSSKWNAIHFADDLLVLAESPEDLQKAIDILKDYYSSWNSQ